MAASSSKQLCASHHSSTAIMSDEEFYEDEEVSNTSKKGDGNFLKARQEAKKGELDEQLREYINEWRKQRAKEEEELKRLKEKQARRKRRSKSGQIVRQEKPPIHLRNCSLSQLHKTTAVDSCCTLQKHTFRPSREIFQLKFTNVSNLCSWDILCLVNKQIIFPFVRFDFTQSPYLKGCFPKLNKDGKLCTKKKK